MTFPESAVCSPSSRENSLGREVTSLIAKQRQFRGDWMAAVAAMAVVVVVALVVGRYCGLDTWAWHRSGVWTEQLADLAGPLMLSRSRAAY